MNKIDFYKKIESSSRHKFGLCVDSMHVSSIRRGGPAQFHGSL